MCKQKYLRLLVQEHSTDGSLSESRHPNGNIWVRSWKPKQSYTEHEMTPELPV